MMRIDSKLFEKKGFTFFKLKLFKFYAKNTNKRKFINVRI